MKYELLEGAICPTRATTGSAGYDLYANATLCIAPRCRKIVPTGVCLQIPENMTGLIWPRSGLAVNCGVDVLAGVIDSDYRGEIGVVLINHGSDVFYVVPGDRIAQIIFQQINTPLMTAGDIDTTERGEGGYGSSDGK